MKNKWLKIGAIAGLCIAPLGILTGCTASADIELTQEDANTLLNGAKTYLENEEKYGAEESEYRQNIQDNLQTYLDRQVILADVESALMNLIKSNISKHRNNTSFSLVDNMTTYDEFGKSDESQTKILRCVETNANDEEIIKYQFITNGSLTDYYEINKINNETGSEEATEKYLRKTYSIDEKNKKYSLEESELENLDGAVGYAPSMISYVSYYNMLIKTIKELNPEISVSFIGKDEIKFSFFIGDSCDSVELVFKNGDLTETTSISYDITTSLGLHLSSYTVDQRIFTYEAVENLTVDLTGYTKVESI